MFIVTVMFAEMLDGYFNAQEGSDDSDTPTVIVFTPDDDVRKLESTQKK